ncbi:MAG TPA: universal stress protein [Vicinamibacteria bacterium]
MIAQHAHPLQAAPAPATTAPATIGTIAVPLDGSPLAEQALPYAVTLARATRASLVLAWLAPASTRAAVYWPAARAWGRREPAAYLRQLAAELMAGGLDVRTSACGLSAGERDAAVTEAVLRWRANLVVVATDEGGAGRSGDEVERILLRRGIPVLRVPVRDPAPRLDDQLLSLWWKPPAPDGEGALLEERIS